VWDLKWANLLISKRDRAFAALAPGEFSGLILKLEGFRHTGFFQKSESLYKITL
jgi:hypothetical protein